MSKLFVLCLILSVSPFSFAQNVNLEYEVRGVIERNFDLEIKSIEVANAVANSLALSFFSTGSYEYTEIRSDATIELQGGIRNNPVTVKCKAVTRVPKSSAISTELEDCKLSVLK